MSSDPFAQVARLEGVGVGASHARDAIDAVLRQPVMRRNAGQVAAASAVQGAQASAELAGAASPAVDDPVVQGALRATRELPGLAAGWESSPRRALARLHLLAARDVVEPDALGRPAPGADSARLDQLLALATAPTAAPAVVVAALVHAELLAIRPFGSLDDVVARAAERLILVVRGVDTKAVTVPEAGHLRLKAAHEPALAAYATGTPGGVGVWVRHCCEAYAYGAERGLEIARSVTEQSTG